jgi:hypothetical protein
MNKVNWSVLPTVLKEKYKTIIEIEYELMVSHLLNESGMMPIKVAENSTNSYLIFWLFPILWGSH